MQLSDVRPSRVVSPPKIIIYGGPKVGKSTLAAGAPSPIFIPCEAGIDSIDTAAFPLCTSWSDVLGCLESLATEEHEFRTVALDSLDWCEPLIWAAVAKAAGKGSIEDIGYGKGYIEAGKYWRELLDGLDWLRQQKAMTVVLICHDEQRKVEPADADGYDVSGLKLHKRALALVTEWADVIGYARCKKSVKSEEGNKHARAVGLGVRVLTLGQNPAYLTGNRYGLPDEIDLSWTAFDAALQAARR